MRRADLDRYWTGVYADEYPVSLDALDLQGVRAVPDFKITFEGGVVAICGLNGCGKTTLVKSIEALSASEDIADCVDLLRLEGLAGTGSFQGDVVSRSVTVNDQEITWIPQHEIPRLRVLDVVRVIRGMRSDVFERDDLEDALNEADFQTLNVGERRDVSYLLGREYTRFEYAEVESHSGLMWPFFRVESLGASYDSRTMGQGELAGCVLLWNLMKKIDGGSAVVLEEPEAFLSPQAQRQLADLLAKYSYEKKLFIVLTTHSEPLLRRIPEENIRMMIRAGGSLAVEVPEYQAQYLDAIGVPRVKEAIIVAEDDVAVDFARTWIRRCNVDFLSRVELIKSGGGANAVERAIQFTSHTRVISVIGLFDGDMNGKDFDGNWPYAFLPGDRDPEGLFQDMAENHFESFCESLGVDEGMMANYLTRIQGLDRHDWLQSIAEWLQLDLRTAVEKLAAGWLNIGAYGEAAELQWAGLQDAFKNATARGVGDNL